MTDESEAIGRIKEGLDRNGATIDTVGGLGWRLALVKRLGKHDSPVRKLSK